MNTGDVHIYDIQETENLYRSNGFRVEFSKKVDKIRFICSAKK